MKISLVSSILVVLFSITALGRPLPAGPTKVLRSAVAETLGVAESAVRAWPNEEGYKNYNPTLAANYFFAVYDSTTGSTDSENDNDVICTGAGLVKGVNIDLAFSLAACEEGLNKQED